MFPLPQYDVVYGLTVKVSVSINGEDCPDVADRVLANGSTRGFLAEAISAKLIENWAEHEPAKGYDFVANNGRLIENKTFTANGAKLGPSDFYGAKRKPDAARFETETLEKDFIIADTSELCRSGHLEFVIKRGEDVVAIGHSVSFGRRDLIFGPRSYVPEDFATYAANTSVVNWV